MRKRRLSISYTFVTLIEGRWRNLLSLLGFWAFDVSFGISNVSSRLFLLYGPSFGVDLQKNTPEGTVAIVRIPIPEPFT